MFVVTKFVYCMYINLDYLLLHSFLCILHHINIFSDDIEYLNMTLNDALSIILGTSALTQSSIYPL